MFYDLLWHHKFELELVFIFSSEKWLLSLFEYDSEIIFSTSSDESKNIIS